MDVHFGPRTEVTEDRSDQGPKWMYPLSRVQSSSVSFVCCEHSFRSQSLAAVSGVRRMNEVNPRRARLLLGWVTVFGQVWRLAMQPTSFVRLANALLKDEESARDNHVLTCNFTKYSPIKKNCCHRQTQQ